VRARVKGESSESGGNHEVKRYKVKRRDYPEICPKCGSKNFEFCGVEVGYYNSLNDAGFCNDCKFTWVTTWKYVKWAPTGEHSEFKEK